MIVHETPQATDASIPEDLRREMSRPMISPALRGVYLVVGFGFIAAIIGALSSQQDSLATTSTSTTSSARSAWIDPRKPVTLTAQSLGCPTAADMHRILDFHLAGDAAAMTVYAAAHCNFYDAGLTGQVEEIAVSMHCIRPRGNIYCTWFLDHTLKNPT